MGLVGFSSGVQDALRQMVTDRIEKQKVEHARRMAEEQLALGQANQRLAQGRFDIDTEVRAEDKRRYEAEAPLRVADLAEKLGRITAAEQEQFLGPEVKRQEAERKQKFQAEQATIAHKRVLELEGLRQKRSTKTSRPMFSGDANRMADMDTGLKDLNELERTLSTPSSTGVQSKIGAILPNVVTEITGWGMNAKSRQGTIDRVKQVIGKTLEGGVLRKEDEYKYTKILPTIGDPAPVAKTKLEGLRKAIKERRQSLIESLSDAGFDTSRFEERELDGDIPQPGEEGVINGIPVMWDGQGWLPKSVQ